ncbi:MAG: mannose-1-phosphate guanylyltransferase/mannose-6-phosphate isomerase [Chromatiales bacterium]|jgi:mannose-1-phosphate guanylyltransferase/mannose-6-phosphate isomerase
MIVPVVLSGGSGTRLWPLSRSKYPKQFLPLTNEYSMLQNTVRRLNGVADLADPLVVCNEHHRFIVGEQLQDIGVKAYDVLLEPAGRNTAPAVALAALRVLADDIDPILAVMASDHVIRDEAAFREHLTQATELAGQGHLVTFGIVPSCPETGYGYIRGGEAMSDQAFKVAQFVEKPDLATAEQYLASGDYYWNSGMFVFRASRYLEELDKYAPDILAACRSAVKGAEHDLDFCRPDRDAFLQCPSDSIDYAVMEHTDAAVVMPLDAGWNDVGSWSALWEVGDQADGGNVTHGDVLLHDVKDSYVFSESRLVSAVGVEDLIIVETKDAVMVAHKNRVQDVKQIVDRLKQDARGECDWHRQVYRPWGHYDSIDVEERFQVKRITVKPGASLSLQMHHHRAEHWIVVSGTGRITRGDEVFLLSENQSTYIPIGTKHRLENPGHVPLQLIEVQSGSYLGEDDIVRFDDVYGREEDKH